MAHGFKVCKANSLHVQRGQVLLTRLYSHDFYQHFFCFLSAEVRTARNTLWSFIFLTQLDFKFNLIEFYNLDFKLFNLGNKQHIFILVFLEVFTKNATIFVLRMGALGFCPIS